MLGSASISAWIRVLEGKVSRCAWIGVLLVVLGSEFQMGIERVS